MNTLAVFSYFCNGSHIIRKCPLGNTDLVSHLDAGMYSHLFLVSVENTLSFFICKRNRLGGCTNKTGNAWRISEYGR